MTDDGGTRHRAPGGTRLPPDLAGAFERVEPARRIVDARPLTGGVSSEIWLVVTDAGPFVVKRALAVLRTNDRWEAPVERSGSEAAWLRLAHTVEPGATPRLHGVDEPTGALVLEYLDLDRFTVWKELLLSGRVDHATAASVGRLLRALHDAFADPAHRSGFDHPSLIHALRLEPYLLRTAGRHPDVAHPLRQLAVDFHDTASTVVHGDVSPKNLLVAGDRVVLLDAECATWGDPMFDLSFCLTHLCAKAAHLPHVTPQLREAVDALRAAYGTIDDAPSERAGRWLAAFLLARVDGASPLEYLDEPTRARVRSGARRLITAPAPTLDQAVERWFAMLGDDGTSATALSPHSGRG
jgi:aminoglycoside phosphotransferase (APT) family kinase protein